MSNSPKAHVNVIRWHVIPEPEEGTRSVMVPTHDGPTFKGDLATVPVICVCGDCGHTLLEGITTSQVQGIVIKCAECGAYNESLDSQAT
jgi:hypothetical protein